MGFAFAAPAPPPSLARVGASPWGRMRHTWKGWDGSEWDLSRPSGGVFLLAKGLEGMGMPDFTNYLTSSPVVHGTKFEGWIATGRKVYWNVGIYSDQGSTDWILRNRAFWRTLQPGRTGVWTIHLPTGEKFSLTLRLAAPDNSGFDRDPVWDGWMAYGIELFPEQPFWEGTEVVEEWDAEDLVPFLGPDDVGPPFFPSPASTIGDATVTNEGDVETYIAWTITGYTRTATIGIGPDKTPIPFEVPEGKKLIVDTNPRNLIAELDGEDVMHLLPDFGPPPLQPGQSIKLSLALDGTGSVEARFTPLKLMGI